MATSGTFQPALEIGMVRENLALAIAYWTAVRKGLITSAHLPAGRDVVTSEAGQVVEVFNPLELRGEGELARCATNQVRGAFAFSAMQTHRTLESVHPKAPLQETDTDVKSARSSIYLLDHSFRQGMLAPVWFCPLGYRQRFEVRSISFLLDTAHLDGTPLSWGDFGGLEKYLELLEYCADLVENMPLVRGRSPGGEGTEPSAMRAGIDEALSGSESVAQFIAERCVVGPDARTMAGALYSEYVNWCRQENQPAMVQRSFGMGLTELGFTRRRRGRGRHWWQGLESVSPAG